MRIFFHLFLMDLKDSHLGPPSCHTELLLSHFPEGSRSDPYQGWQILSALRQNEGGIGIPETREMFRGGNPREISRHRVNPSL